MSLVVVYHGYGGREELVIEEQVQQSKAYLEHLWWVMHHSYDATRASFALTSYLDDSGSDDLSPITAIGGPLFSKEAFADFSVNWSKMLRRYRVESPLHMTEFNGFGRYAGMLPEIKMALFAEVCDLIVKYRLFSISVTVPQIDFRTLLPREVCKKVVGPYAMAFFCVVLSTHTFSSNSILFAAQRVAFVLDTGFSFSGQLIEAHAAIIKTFQKKREPCFVGAMAFDSDDQVPALQAADVIAWCARKSVIDGKLPEQFAPLDKLFNSHHAEIKLDTGAIKMMATPINNWLSAGVVPSFSDFLR